MKNLIVFFIWHISTLAFSADKMWESYKDEHFTPKLLAQAPECNVSYYDYDEIEHVNGQDCAKESGFHFPMTQPDRITRLDSVRRERTDIPGVKATWEIGPEPGKGNNVPKCAVIWCHGAVESTHPHHLGARDTNFGGNNNRLANLAIQQNCTYYSPNFRGAEGYYAIQNLVDYLREKGVEEVFVSASSAGASALNILASNSNNNDILGGLFYTGTYITPEYVSRTPAFKAGVPIVFSQGANDKYQEVRDSYFKVKEKYPRKHNLWMQVFRNGGHGTPIRMIDWRHTLNWARAQNNNRKEKVEVSLMSNDGVSCPQNLTSMNLNDFLKQKNDVIRNLQNKLKNKVVGCSTFESGGRFGLPIDADLKKTKGCFPLIRDQNQNIIASVNQINCVASKGENIPGNYSYDLKNLEIREVLSSDIFIERPGCDKQAGQSR